MSDFDPIKWSTRLDGHGLAPAVEPDQYAQWGGHGMEAVKINLCSLHVRPRSEIGAVAMHRMHPT